MRLQIGRLFEIVYLLLDKHKMTAAELATHFEVSPRTIYRDIELLSEAGIPVYMSKGKGGGIALLPEYVLNKAVLTAQEKRELLASLSAVEAVAPAQTVAVLGKLSALLGKPEADWIEVDFSSWGGVETQTVQWETLKTAILNKNQVCFLYSNGKGETAKRKVEPLKLCFKGQGWYLYGYCHTRQAERFFKLTRMRKLELLTEKVQHTAPHHVLQGRRHFPDRFVTLTLHIDAEMAFRVYDELKIYTQQPDGSFIATIAMPDGEWLYQYLFSYGPHCRVLAPVQVRQELRSYLQKILACC